MTAKEYLEKVQEKQDFWQLKKLEVQQLKCLETSTTVSLNPNKVQSSGDKDKLGSAICKRIVFEEEVVKKAEQDFLTHRANCIELLEQLMQESFKHYKILHLKYIDYFDLETTAEKASYSYQRAKELHTEGIAKFQKILDLNKIHTQSY